MWTAIIGIYVGTGIVTSLASFVLFPWKTEDGEPSGKAGRILSSILYGVIWPLVWALLPPWKWWDDNG
jgi:hypothetical protein